MFQLLKPGHTIPFMKLAMPATIFSGILILLSIFTIATKGFNWGLDFTGGTIAELKFSQPAALDQVRSALNKQGLEGAVVQYYGSPLSVQHIAVRQLWGGRREAGCEVVQLFPERQAEKSLASPRIRSG